VLSDLLILVPCSPSQPRVEVSRVYFDRMEEFRRYHIDLVFTIFSNVRQWELRTYLRTDPGSSIKVTCHLEMCI
jgi:hypothetical protein